MNILVKIPTRERGFDWLAFYLHLSRNEGTRFLISLDEDDLQPRNSAILADSRVTVVEGHSKSKIDAINRDINEHGGEWDMLIVGSDDMVPLVQDYDTLLFDQLQKHQPQGCLWVATEDSQDRRRVRRPLVPGSEQYLRDWICMLPIMSRAYYEQFGYVYHPSYRSFWCDNEYTDVARRAGKITFIPGEFFKHKHPAWDPEGKDDGLYRLASKGWNPDMQNYRRRKQRGFPK